MPRTTGTGRIAMVVVLAGLATACAEITVVPVSTPSEPASSAPASEAPAESPADLVDLDVDACAFLDLATVQRLTGASTEFATDSNSSASSSRCFWGSTTPGVGGYVEVSLFRQTGLSGFSYGEGCTKTPIDGVGDEAEFATCPPDPTQAKFYLLGFERGVIVSLLVNDPAEPLTPDDLAPVVQSVFEQLR